MPRLSKAVLGETKRRSRRHLFPAFSHNEARRLSASPRMPKDVLGDEGLLGWKVSKLPVPLFRCSAVAAVERVYR